MKPHHGWARVLFLVGSVLSQAGCGLHGEDSEIPIGEASFASSVHLKGGKNAEPSFRDLGLTLRAAGELAGLGSGDVLVTLTATAQPTATCTNPSGGNQPPGQNPAEVVVAGAVSIPEADIKNGNTPFSVTTLPPATPILGAPDCPNPHWTEDITDLAFTSATIEVEQPAGTIVLTMDCDIAAPTNDGPVNPANVVCVVN